MKAQLKHAGYQTRNFGEFLIDQLRVNECGKTAGSLTYTSLFAVVPLLTVVFSVLSIMPSFEDASSQVIELIFSNLIPVGDETLRTYILQFAKQARSLTWVGMVILVITAYLMLNNIEKAFNRIWRIRQGRTRLSAFLLYWAMMSAGPLLLGVGLAVTTYIKSATAFIDGFDASPLWGLFPFFLNTLLLLMLYVAVPNCKVNVRRALVGAVVTAALFELAKHGFALVMSYTNYELIYGTFAVVPLFLIWLWLTWLLILAGAVAIRAMSTYRITESSDQPRFVVALKILFPIWQRHQQGKTTQWDRFIDGSYAGAAKSLEQWEEVREQLIELEILTPTPSGSLTLRRSLSNWPLWSLYEVMLGADYLPYTSTDNTGWESELSDRLDLLTESRHNKLGLTVEQLFQSKGREELDVNE